MISVAALKLPNRFRPVLPLFERAWNGDDEARLVVDDWIESQEWNVAHDLWLATKPTDFQRSITLLVIGRGTTSAHYPEGLGNINGFHEAFAEAKRQLGVHRHTHWIRYIKLYAQTGPKEGEAIMDYNGADLACMQFRTRCKVPGCINTSLATQKPHVDTSQTLRPGPGVNPRRSTQPRLAE